MFHFEQVTSFAGWDPAKYLEAAQTMARDLRDSLSSKPLDGVTPGQCAELDALVANTRARMASGDTADMQRLWGYLGERRRELPKVYTHTSLTDFAATGLAPEPYYRESRLGTAYHALQQALGFSWL